MPKTRKSVPSKTASSALASWARQGVESLVATQKIILNLAAQQNSLALGLLRERLPGSGLLEFAAQGTASFIATQQLLLELAAQENTIIHQGVKDGLGLTGPAAAVADVAHGSVDAFIAMQKKFVDLAVEQGQIIVQSAISGEPLAGVAAMAEKAQEGLRIFVQTQERFLTLVAEQANPRPAQTNRKTSKPVQRKKLTALAKEGIDAFVAVEKQLLDISSAQIAAAQAAMRPKSEEVPTSLGEVARRSLANLANAQMALLEVATKPFLSPPAPRPAARRQ